MYHGFRKSPSNAGAAVLPPGPPPHRPACRCLTAVVTAQAEQRARQQGTASTGPRKACPSPLATSLWGDSGQIGNHVTTLNLTSRFVSFYCFVHASVHTHTTEFWRLILKRATALVCTKGGSAKSDCLRRWENILVSPNTRTSSSFNKDDYYRFHWLTASKSNYWDNRSS